MDRTKFFEWVWRANALVILAAGIAGLGFAGMLGFVLVSDMFETRASGVVNLADDQVDAEALDLGYFHRIEGSEWMRAALEAEQEYARGSATKRAASERNVFFVDPRSGEHRWLLPSHDALILRHWSFPDTRAADAADPGPVVIHVWRVVLADTNGNQRLSDRDRSAIGVSGPEGAGFAVVVDAVDAIRHVSYDAAAREVDLLYERDGVLRSAAIAVELRALVRDSAVLSLRDVLARAER